MQLGSCKALGREGAGLLQWPRCEAGGGEGPVHHGLCKREAGMAAETLPRLGSNLADSRAVLSSGHCHPFTGMAGLSVWWTRARSLCIS